MKTKNLFISILAVLFAFPLPGHSPSWLAKENVLIRIRVKRRIETDEIDVRIGKFFPIGK